MEGVEQHSALYDFIGDLLIWVIRMPPFVLQDLDFFLCNCFHLFLSLMFCDIHCYVWLCTLSGGPGCAVCSHWQMAFICCIHDCHPIIYLSKMDSDQLFQCSPSFRQQGQNDFSPHTDAEMLRHLKALLICNP